MKKFVWILSFFVSTNLCAQDWRLVSQNNQNSGNFTPANVWMSPSGNRLAIAVFAKDSIGLLNQTFSPSSVQLDIYLETDTVFNAREVISINNNSVLTPLAFNWAYINDSLIAYQFRASGGNFILDYATLNYELLRGVLNLSNRKVISKLSRPDTDRGFVNSNGVFINRRFRSPEPFAGSIVYGSALNYFTHFLAYGALYNEHFSIPTTFYSPDSTLVGAITGRFKFQNKVIFEGATIKNGGRVFDEFIDDADILAITDTLGNKKKVFHARKATFKYINYDGNNIYYTCECFPNISFVQNTPMPGFSLAKLDSAGRVKWVHRIPPDASVVQDTAFRTYIFGHQRNAEPLFGETMGNNELYMAVVDTDGTVLHFEHDSNFFWPNSYFYKLLYSPVTGVNLFMSHIEPVSLGNLQVVNDSASQNMFLARFALLEAQDTSGNSSLNEAKSDGRLFLYPNPSSKMLNLSYLEEISSIRIIDMQGKVVLFEESAPARQKQIDIAELNPGSYIIQAKSNNTWVKQAFVKE